ncbi:hypothetical protein ABB28_06295 [Stenotrophomonas chelatiphaga]|uniref:Uncharacterized protein n=1 Tax=Stenotrophomonas chelatiphaga TaxID=517011 RepID=A0A0R0D0G4_9GAMM|nr:hypothetical protein [Stenotrophomonas chelatiphaga]KRG74843.1 hypothetical protein ABB28_06295 [Stenotrophomonas chelatiphaga]
MFLVKTSNSNAVVPGFLLGWRGGVMLPDYTRYMATLPLFALANFASAALGTYALAAGGSSLAFISFSACMAIFSATMFTQRLVRVDFPQAGATAVAAPLAVRLNTLFRAASLAATGTALIRLEGDSTSPLFKVLGLGLLGVAAGLVLALRRGGAHPAQ